MTRNIVTLVLNDLAIAFRNKTIYLVLFIPLFVFFSLKLLDKQEREIHKMELGLVQPEKYPAAITESLKAADKIFSISNIPGNEEGKRRLKEKKIDGFLAKSEQGLELFVLTEASLRTIAIVEGLSALQLAAEGKGRNWIAGIRSVQDNSIRKETMPTWVLMLVLLVSFVIMPAQVAEEKEKNLLLGLLQTPIREIEWITAKSLTGMLLIFISLLVLHLPDGFEVGTNPGYVAFVLAGSFCFSSLGVVLGSLCRNQGSARTLGVLVYLPLLLPPALSEFSEKLNNISSLLPSYHFYGPARAILLEDGRFSAYYPEFIYLASLGFMACLLSNILMKRRWLM